MKRTFLSLFLISFCALVSRADMSDSVFVEKILENCPEKVGSLYFARFFLGSPYVAHTLEVNNEEQLVVNLKELDCTTLVENVVALSLCNKHGKKSFPDFISYLSQIRYRDGKLKGYPSRLHYFSDWIIDNTKKDIVYEINDSLAPFTAVQTLNIFYMSTHPEAYDALKKHKDFIVTIKQHEQRLTGLKYPYIPKNQVNNNSLMRKNVHDGDIIAITTNKPGLDIAHLGFAVWRNNGLHLLNASQIHHRVVEEPMTLYQYLQKHPSHTGIRVIRLK